MRDSRQVYLAALMEHTQVCKAAQGAMADQVGTASSAVVDALASGGMIFFCGNGGSAGDAQHLAAELVGRYKLERPGLRAIALTTDTSLLTAVANDYDYDQVFSRQVEALGSEGDVLVAISTSGNSANVVAAAQAARALGMVSIGMTGENGGRLADHCTHMITAPSAKVARIQELHILAGHAICEAVDEWYAVASKS